MPKRADQVRSLVRLFLAEKIAPTPEEISEAVREAIAIASTRSGLEGEVVQADLIREFESIYAVFFAMGPQVIEDRTGHVPWLTDRKAEVQWQFWGRYEHFLGERKRMAPQVVARLNADTDEILSRLEQPERPGAWDRRGLVVGNVQSGKTSNYSGLICKALDSGYKLVVILAGLHNSLRSQTQMRIDQGIIGFDTSQNPVFSEKNQWIGVGAMAGWPRLRVNALTNSRNNGDFNRNAASHITTSLGGDPYVLVVKKHKSILGNLIKWALHVNGVPTEDGRKIIPDVPLLLIDDEADNASVNTASVPEGADPSDYDPSAINGKIRELLTAFQKRAYVGYTATPFANIFVPLDVAHEKLQDDIFPRSFIYSLSEPSNYVGPAKVFGLERDPDSGIEEQPGLPIVFDVEDHEQYFPAGYRKDHDPGGLPPSLDTAIREFILSTAARRARGKVADHNSMLIHVARFVDVQRRVHDYVQALLEQIRGRIRYGRQGSDPIWAELEQIWEERFVPVTIAMASEGYQPLPWKKVEVEVREAVEKMKLKLINGEASDFLDYHEHPNGINVIAIGGDKLSRGLTLDGLTVSYYLRASRMYDTLMQMGRWFGYRDGYLDLCRLYTTGELIDWYRHIALADVELRREFQTMVDCGMTPKDYGLRVRTHPDGLLITALNKSRYSTTMRVSFAGRLVQTKYLLADDNSRMQNRDAVTRALNELGEGMEVPNKQQLVWRSIRSEWICGLLMALNIPLKDVEANGERLAKFIAKQRETGGLQDWTVLLAGSARSDGRDAAFKSIWPIIRRPADESGPVQEMAVMALKNANILNPPDQYIDFVGARLTEDHLEELRERDVFKEGGGLEDLQIMEACLGHDLVEVATRISVARHRRQEIRGVDSPSVPNGGVVRDMRKMSEGLLILYPTVGGERDASRFPMAGFAISFPRDENARPIEYLVNNVYKQLHLTDPDEQP